jgi:nitrate/nitrite transporter NarK
MKMLISKIYTCEQVCWWQCWIYLAAFGGELGGSKHLIPFQHVFFVVTHAMSAHFMALEAGRHCKARE